jgi:hypothetical protein
MMPLSFEHVQRLSDHVGIFEHADHTTPRREHGYCVDDVARLLIVLVRQPSPNKTLNNLERVAMRFLGDSQTVDGRVRDRCDVAGRWSGPGTVNDAWGRSMWAFGTAAARSTINTHRQAGLAYFGHGTEQRSPHRRAMAFAALGAAEVLMAEPHHQRARNILADAAAIIGRPGADPEWPWPEARLSYANAAVAEALIAAGVGLVRPELVDDGLALLAWLLARETRDGHLSPTPVHGSGPGDHGPGFDQQPIEVAAMADACYRAYTATEDTSWLYGIEMAGAWFEGDNDAGAPMIDAESGGGYDGLRADGPNLNQGAESTLAMVSTMQHAKRLTTVA